MLGILFQPGDIRGCCVNGSVAEGRGRGAASGSQLEGRVRSMLTLGLGFGLGLGLVRVMVRVRRPCWIPTETRLPMTIRVIRFGRQLGLGLAKDS